MDPRRRMLLRLLQAALAAVEGRAAVRAALAARPAPAGRCALIAVGKAAAAMALGAHDALGASIERTLIITKHGHVPPEARRLPAAEIIEAAHPLPDASSLAAGEALARTVASLDAALEPLCLVSGGASSLCELLAPGASLEALRALSEHALAAGWPIGALNAARARLSLLKGGGLTRRLAGRPALALFISDVPGDDPAVIASGLLAPVAGDRIERRIVARLEQALAAAAWAAQREFARPALIAPQRFAEDAELLAGLLVRELADSPTPVRLWGGESTVRLPERPGRGGRNQHLALAAARRLAGRADLLLLCAGTDGTDGPTEDAGALIDGGTCERIALAGGDADEALRGASSGEALAAAGDLLHIGPTGTNVGDLVIGLREAPVL